MEIAKLFMRKLLTIKTTNGYIYAIYIHLQKLRVRVKM